MASDLVGQHQLTTFTTPSNGQSPIDANQVKGNDNTIKTSYNAHDSDFTIHLQSSLASARPAAATAGDGAKWLDNDTFRIYYSDGAAWNEIGYFPAGQNILVSAANATVTVNATSGNPAFVFEKAAVTTAYVASGAADEIDFLDHLGVSMGSWIAGAVTFAGNLTINTNKFVVTGSSGNTLIAGTVTMSTAASQIVPGATSLAFRNNANSANNLIILDSGAATFRTSVSSPSYLGTALALTGGITSSGSTGAGIGYATGAGGAVTQVTNRTAAVTLNKLTGAITTDTTSLAATGSATFTVNNTTVAATDTVELSIKGGAVGLTIAWVSTVAANSFAITLYCISGTETGAIVISFAVIKAVAS